MRIKGEPVSLEVRVADQVYCPMLIDKELRSYSVVIGRARER